MLTSKPASLLQQARRPKTLLYFLITPLVTSSSGWPRAAECAEIITGGTFPPSLRLSPGKVIFTFVDHCAHVDEHAVRSYSENVDD